LIDHNDKLNFRLRSGTYKRTTWFKFTYHYKLHCCDRRCHFYNSLDTFCHTCLRTYFVCSLKYEYVIKNIQENVICTTNKNDAFQNLSKNLT